MRLSNTRQGEIFFVEMAIAFSSVRRAISLSARVQVNPAWNFALRRRILNGSPREVSDGRGSPLCAALGTRGGPHLGRAAARGAGAAVRARGCHRPQG